MNRQELLEKVAKESGLELTKKDSELFLNTTLDVIKKAVKKGEDVSLIGFGTFTKVRRKARTGINPATGEKLKIKAKNVPKFRPGKAWKDLL
ncbi:MAG: HU family DNA-binding protein [Bdellovibrionota bacterium]|nr:HU family DNA-binding protein [Bdellovibrionota bacterium]